MHQTANAATPVEKQEGQMGKWAPYYDLLMFFMTFGREKTLRRITLDLAGVKSGDRVLEIGSGTGSLTIAAGKRVGTSGEATGIDIAPEMVAVARRKVSRKQVGAIFQLGSIDKIPFPENRFDVVMCSFMIFHMPEEVRRRGFTEISRVLKSGGRLLIVDFAWPDRMGYGQYHLRTLEPVLKEYAFTDIELAKMDFMKWLGWRTAGGMWYIRGKAKKK